MAGEVRVFWVIFGVAICEAGADEQGFQLLGSESFVERNEGSARLTEWVRQDWAGAREAILERFFASGDPETRHRLRAILASNFQSERPGHLGIRFRVEERRGEDGEDFFVAKVVEVLEDGSAVKAGILQRDEITAVEGVEVEDHAGFVRTVKSLRAGDRVEVSLVRANQPLKVRVTLKEKPGSEALNDEEKEVAFTTWLSEREPEWGEE